MASLVLKMSVSLDGYIAPVDGSTDWIAAGGSDDGLSWTIEPVSHAGAHLMGAATYAVIPANGKQPDAVIAAWQWVYGSDLARTYSGDFDLYVSTGPDAADLDVSLHVAIGTSAVG